MITNRNGTLCNGVETSSITGAVQEQHLPD